MKMNSGVFCFGECNCFVSTGKRMNWGTLVLAAVFKLNFWSDFFLVNQIASLVLESEWIWNPSSGGAFNLNY